MSRTSFLMATLSLATVWSVSVAEDTASPKSGSPEIEKPWTEAKAAYRDQLKKLSDEVFARVASLEKKARESGDLERVKQYKAMADAYTDTGELPPVVNRSDHDRKRKRLQEQLRREAKLTMAAYLKENRDEEAEDVNRELTDLLAADEGNESDVTEKAAYEDRRKRFVNTSYFNVIVQVRGRKWKQLDQKTNKHTWWLTETSRDDEYIYVYCADRKQSWRIGEARMDLLQPDKTWTWLSNGYWENASDR